MGLTASRLRERRSQAAETAPRVIPTPTAEQRLANAQQENGRLRRELAEMRKMLESATAPVKTEKAQSKEQPASETHQQAKPENRFRGRHG
jgi:hypothetical protein